MAIDMSSPTLAHPKGSTKLDRAIANKAARLADKKALEVWSRAVKDRDRWTDRKTGVKVHSTKQLDPLRAEAHHIEPKATRATRYDLRNGVTLSLATHQAVELGQLRIEGTVYFRVGGARYIDGTYPVHFVRI